MTCEGGTGSTDEQGDMDEGVTNEVRKRRGKMLDGKQQIFKWRLRLAPRWAPSCARVLWVIRQFQNRHLDS